MTAQPPERKAHFEALYAANEDPWNVRGAWYERRKRAVLLASLARPHYRSVYEPGCGNGEMSAALALRCERLLASDGSPSALAAARRRLQEGADPASTAPGHVRFEQLGLPDEWPADTRFDLVVISEFAYYLDAAALDDMLRRARASLDDDGELVLCHYLHGFDDHITPTATVHAMAGRLPGLVRTLHHRDADFLLEAWQVAPDSSSNASKGTPT